MTNINILKDNNNSTTTTTNEETKMTNINTIKYVNNSTMTKDDKMNNKIFKLYCKSIEDSFGVELKYYRDTLLRIQKVGENLIIGVYFHPVENEDWKQRFISAFSGPIPEVILSDPENEDEEEIIKKEIKLLTEKMNKVCYELQPRSDIFHKSLEEIEKDYSGIENVEIIVKPNEICNYITESDVALWRIYKRVEDY